MGELEEVATTEKSSVVQNEGKRRIKYILKYYNLEPLFLSPIVSISGTGRDFTNGLPCKEWLLKMMT